MPAELWREATALGCVFRNRRRTSLKVLVYDGQGPWLCQKRLSKGRFPWWPSGERSAALEAHELQVLLSAGDPSATGAAQTLPHEHHERAAPCACPGIAAEPKHE